MNSSSVLHLQHTINNPSDQETSTNMLAAKNMATAAMMTSRGAVVKLAQELLRIPSITPNDLGAQEIIRQRLEKVGFKCETLQYHDVTNLWGALEPLSSGKKRLPLVTFLGHTDVVPTGPESAWTYPPFDAAIEVDHETSESDVLYGRGAVDMKGGIASFIIGLEEFLLNNRDEDQQFRIGVLLTSDEEGDAKCGSRETLEELKRRGEVIDMCIVGEPSSLNQVGDVVKVGRRGSLSGDLSIIGIQGTFYVPRFVFLMNNFINYQTILTSTFS
jgi:succinyl-diaminopimelate desuccinylase